MSYILNIGTAVPDHSLTQSEFCEIYSSMTKDSDTQRKIKFLTARSAINKRNCIEPDIKKLVAMPLEEKLTTYHDNALKLAIRAIENNKSFHSAKDQITDIIFISCTGMQAPGVEIDIINHYNLPTTIRRYNVNFMGCYASLTGLRMANDICTTPNRTVLLVSVELCTLHFQNKFIDDYLLSNSIFADGAASVIISSNETNAKLKLEDFESRLIPNSKEEMSWKISPDGFLMTLSSEVPSSIKQSLEKTRLFNREPNSIGWAIHPGGKQIVDGIKSTLGLHENELAASRKVLLENGNMSSATILFVISEMLTNPTSTKNEFIACAFGPGLTLESALLSYV
ncbi:MAG: naringenin-chalcone synthase [Bacteroidetes bacterium]|nr:MAG: naringenin-chalcone synthase [Bacteroidota bacterium]